MCRLLWSSTYYIGVSNFFVFNKQKFIHISFIRSLRITYAFSFCKLVCGQKNIHYKRSGERAVAESLHESYVSLSDLYFTFNSGNKLEALCPDTGHAVRGCDRRRLPPRAAHRPVPPTATRRLHYRVLSVTERVHSMCYAQVTRPSMWSTIRDPVVKILTYHHSRWTRLGKTIKKIKYLKVYASLFLATTLTLIIETISLVNRQGNGFRNNLNQLMLTW